jgi:hypothetical protein
MAMPTTADKPRYRIEIVRDDEPRNPREDYDNFGTMACWHRSYNLGDKHNFSDPIDLMREMVNASVHTGDLVNFIKSGKANGLRVDENPTAGTYSLTSLWDFNGQWHEEYGGSLPIDTSDVNLRDAILDNMSIGDLRRFAERSHVIMPLYLYDHSGITMSTSDFNDRWDSGQVGFIYVSHEKIADNFGSVTPENLEKTKKLLKGEVQDYDCHLRGERYGFRLYDRGEEIDSCWGFLGDFHDAKAAIADYLPEQVAALVDSLDYFKTEAEEAGYGDEEEAEDGTEMGDDDD